MTDSQDIRFRRDGSIDTGYYMDRGRVRRSEAAHEMAGRTIQESRSVLTALVVLIASFHLHRGQS